MSYEFCLSIVRMVGVFTVSFGATFMAYSLIEGLAALHYVSKMTGGSAMRQFSGAGSSGAGEMLVWSLLAKASIVVAGILLVLLSPRLTKLILQDPGSKPAPATYRRQFPSRQPPEA